MTEDKKEAVKRAIAMQFVLSTKNCFGDFRRELYHDMLKGEDNYPKDKAEALEIMSRWMPRNQAPVINTNSVAFATNAKGTKKYLEEDYQRDLSADGEHPHI
jgi:hypothetical protein